MNHLAALMLLTGATLSTPEKKPKIRSEKEQDARLAKARAKRERRRRKRQQDADQTALWPTS